MKLANPGTAMAAIDPRIRRRVVVGILPRRPFSSFMLRVPVCSWMYPDMRKSIPTASPWANIWKTAAETPIDPRVKVPNHVSHVIHASQGNHAFHVLCDESDRRSVDHCYESYCGENCPEKFVRCWE